MYNFTNKYICLVLTCNKQQYQERLDKHHYIYSKINKAGFEIIFLYANPNISDFEFIQLENGYYKLTVPTEERYKNLATKMLLAYKFFSTTNIKGILKIDDDIYHINDLVLDLDYYEADYIGVEKVLIEAFCYDSIDNRTYTDVPIIINDYDINKYKYYFIGHLYWVSNKAIQHIVKSKYDPKIICSEDVFVGLSLADKADIKRFATIWKDLGYVNVLDGLGI